MTNKEDRKQSNSALMDDEQEGNFNQMAELELNLQRKERKDILKKKADDARRKIELEEARKKKRNAE